MISDDLRDADRDLGSKRTMNQLPGRTVAAAGGWILAIKRAMDPALGPDRLVVAGPHEREVIMRVCEWLEGRTGYEGGGFTSADDVRQAILAHFGGQS